LLIAVEPSREMLDKAMQWVAQRRWYNVIPINTAVAEFNAAVSVDAVLLCATHDLLRSPSTLANVFRHVRAGARVAATGGKWAAPWLWPMNVLVFQLHAPYVNSFDGFDRPWRNLQAYCGTCTCAGSGGTPAFWPLGRPRRRPRDGHLGRPTRPTRAGRHRAQVPDRAGNRVRDADPQRGEERRHRLRQPNKPEALPA
jgi:hypothetical protein